MNTLVVQSNLLQKEAYSVLEDLKLLTFLKEKFGETQIVGSVELNLMTWRDIDIEVISRSTPSKNDAIDVVRLLFNNTHVRKVSPIDYTDSDGVKKPKGLYIGTDYVDSKNEKWKIDIWLLDKNSSRSFEITEDLKKKLTPELREKILEIKNILYSHPKYRKDFGSMDIYTAVIENKISTMQEFKQYIENKNISF